ncbi:MAG: HIT family protein [archaeon]
MANSNESRPAAFENIQKPKPAQANTPPQSTCIFCRIASGDSRAYKLYEGDSFIAILDAFPVTEGHALILPRKHYKTFFDVPSAEIPKIFEAARFVAGMQKKALSADGFNIATAPSAIDHFHIHVVPRYDYDMMGPLADLDNKREMSPEKMKEIFGKLSAEIAKHSKPQ